MKDSRIIIVEKSDFSIGIAVIIFQKSISKLIPKKEIVTRLLSIKFRYNNILTKVEYFCEQCLCLVMEMIFFCIKHLQ